MSIAVISDIHSNFHALDSVLKDISARGIKQIYCAGDLVGYGPHPNQVIELIRTNNIPAVMGNYDDAIGNMRLVCGCAYKDEESLRLGEISLAWTKGAITEENRQWISMLPRKLRFSFSGLRALMVHGSPGALNEYVYEDAVEDYLVSLFRENDADVILCGHTHLPYIRRTAAGHVVNAGSVGKPKHGNPNAAYVVLGPDQGGLKGEIIEVPYNYEQTAREIEMSGLPAEFARQIRTGDL